MVGYFSTIVGHFWTIFGYIWTTVGLFGPIVEHFSKDYRLLLMVQAISDPNLSTLWLIDILGMDIRCICDSSVSYCDWCDRRWRSRAVWGKCRSRNDPYKYFWFCCSELNQTWELESRPKKLFTTKTEPVQTSSYRSIPVKFLWGSSGTTTDGCPDVPAWHFLSKTVQFIHLLSCYDS